jgi:hypothetical protein
VGDPAAAGEQAAAGDPAGVGEPASAPIGAHRLIGDGRSTALIRPDAEIDWWCAPEMDSPPLAWSLLDGTGAAARWGGARMVTVDPRPAGPTARTLVRIEAATVECWDGLLWQDGGGTVLVRAVRCAKQPLDVTHELRLGGFDAGFADWEGATVTVGEAKITVHGGLSSADGQALRTRLRAPSGTWAVLTVGVDATPPDEPPQQVVAKLAAAEQAESDALAGAKLPRVHPERAADALAVLRACTYRPTGMVVASPTTSLPEAPGGDRQFDYRYSWLRDTGLAVSVAALLGQVRLAEQYLGTIVEILDEEPLPFAPLRTVRGDATPEEREISGVAGWLGSRPIRVGNAAASQTQYDALAMLVEAISVHVQMGGRLLDGAWALVVKIADAIATEVIDERDVPAENGIWEVREPRPFLSSDIGRWMALDRAIWVARGWSPRTPRGHWKRARRSVRDRVLQAMDERGRLPQAYGDPPSRADGSNLMAAVFHLVEARDPRSRRLVDAVLDSLGSGPFVYRYEPGGQDGFGGREGAFVPVSWWAVAALAGVGRLEEATVRTDAMCRLLPRLLAEEVEPATGQGLGNVPLVWSHMEAARALYVLDAAVRRRRWGVVGLGVWRITRFLQARRARPDQQEESA